MNEQVLNLLRDYHPRTYAAYEIVRCTGLSFETVRRTLNKARDKGLVERDLDIGLNGHTLFQWYWCGGDDSDPRARPLPMDGQDFHHEGES